MTDGREAFDEKLAAEVLGVLADEPCDFCDLPLSGEGSENCAHCPFCHKNNQDGCAHIVIWVWSDENGDPSEILGRAVWPPTLPAGFEYSDEEVRAALGDYADICDVFEGGLDELPSTTDFIVALVEYVDGADQRWTGGLGSPVDCVYYAKDPQAVGNEALRIVGEIVAVFETLAVERAADPGAREHDG